MRAEASEKRRQVGHGGYIGLETAGMLEVVGPRRNCRYGLCHLTMEAKDGLGQVNDVKVIDSHDWARRDKSEQNWRRQQR